MLNAWLALLGVMALAAFICVLLAFRAPVDHDPTWDEDDG